MSVAYERSPSVGEKELLSSVNRQVYEHFPEMRRTLLDPLRRNAFHNLLLSLLRHAPEHSLTQCIVRVSKEGYTVTRSTGTEPREPGTTRGADVSDPPLRITPGSQRALLLAAFWEAGNSGLTSEEARDLAKVSPRSCYWKRVSELHDSGYIERVEDASGDDVRRRAESGSLQRVYQITPFGLETIESLL